MALGLSIKLSDDLLHGVPEDLFLIKPVLIAQNVFNNNSIEEKHVRKIMDEFIDVLEGWKLEHGDPTPPGLASPIPNDCSELKPWECAGFMINSAYDLYTKLYYDKYLPVVSLSNKYPDDNIYAVIILREALRSKHNSLMDSNASQIRLSTFQSAFDLLQLIPTTKSTIDLINEHARSIYPKLYKLAAKDMAKKLARRGGLQKGKKRQTTREFFIELFNKGQYPSLKNGAEEIYEDLVAKGTDLKVHFPNSGDPIRSITRILSIASKKGLLQKKVPSSK